MRDATSSKYIFQIALSIFCQVNVVIQRIKQIVLEKKQNLKLLLIEKQTENVYVFRLISAHIFCLVIQTPLVCKWTK